MAYLQLACPYCAGQFSAAASTEKRVMACPHCGHDVTVPAAPPPPPPATSSAPAQSPQPDPSTSDSVPPTLPAEPAAAGSAAVERPLPPRRLSPQERARLRRRVNFAIALIGMAILAVAMTVLLRLRP